MWRRVDQRVQGVASAIPGPRGPGALERDSCLRCDAAQALPELGKSTNPPSLSRLRPKRRQAMAQSTRSPTHSRLGFVPSGKGTVIRSDFFLGVTKAVFEFERSWISVLERSAYAECYTAPCRRLHDEAATPEATSGRHPTLERCPAKDDRLEIPKQSSPYRPDPTSRHVF